MNDFFGHSQGARGNGRCLTGGLLLAPLIFLACNRSGPDGAAPSGPEREGLEASILSEIAKDGPEPDEGYRIVRVSISRQNRMLRRDFELDMAKAGRFFLKAWAESPKAVDWTVYVDGHKAEELVLRVEPGSWGYAELRRPDGSPTPLALPEGRHTLSFEGAGPAVPAMERIWLSESGSPSVPDNGYADYQRRLQSPGTLEPAGALAKRADDSRATYAYGTKYAGYTWNTMLWLEPNVSYQFTTSTLSPSATCDPVMYLFNDADPNLFSKMNDQDVTRNPWIGTKVPTAGYYRLLISAQTSEKKGTATVLMNGATLGTSCAVAGEYMPVWAAEQYNEQNYFTGRPGVDATVGHPDTRIWLISDFASGRRVRMHNDDFYGGTYSWNRLSRIKATISTPIENILLSTYSSGTSGYVNLLGKVFTLTLTSDHTTVFPNLNATDAMRSAPKTPSGSFPYYNCYAYAGGITSSWQVPSDPGNPWYVAGNRLASFDNYFSNRCAVGGSCPRYSGAWPYTRTGANDNNAYVALWARTASPTEFTHASVRGTANNHPHGYDWESKLGAMERVFHPRNALNNENLGAYGHIVHLYTYGSLAKTAAGGAEPSDGLMSVEASLERGLTKVEPREALQPAHLDKIRALKSRSGSFDEAEFSSLYEGWKQEWNSPMAAFQSSYSAFKDLPGYGPLLRYSREHKAAALAALAEKLGTGEAQASALLQDIALPDYQARLDEELKAWRDRAVDAEGRVTLFSQENTWIRFAKRVLENDL